MSSWWIACWRRRTTASAGAATGSTSPATPTPTATASTPRAPSGRTATGSSTRSTTTCPSTSSSSSSWPATCCRTRRPDQSVATGFHRNTPINEEGGIDVEQFRVESIVDRVNTTGSVFLGLTVGCCQCHDHKFDPISQREYYQLFAFFNSVDEPKLELPTPEQTKKRAELEGRIAAVEKQLKTLDAATPESLQAWEGRLTAEDKSHAAGEGADAPGHRRQRPRRQAAAVGARRLPPGRPGAARRRGPGRDQPAGSAGRFAGARRPHRPWKGSIADLKRDLPVIPSTLVVQRTPGAARRRTFTSAATSRARAPW